MAIDLRRSDLPARQKASLLLLTLFLTVFFFAAFFRFFSMALRIFGSFFAAAWTSGVKSSHSWTWRISMVMSSPPGHFFAHLTASALDFTSIIQ